MQLAAGASGAVQLLEALNCEALAPLREIEETWRGALPELMAVSVWAALEVPCVVAGNDGAGGERLSSGTRAMPVPLRTTVCGDPWASSAIVRSAVRWPGAVGSKTSEIVQLEPGASGAAQLLVKLKSEGLGPVRETEEMCSVVLPELMTVKVWGALEPPCVVLGKDSAGGEKVTAGEGAMPVPLRTRVCGVPGALSAIWRLAVDGPTAAGVKVMLTEQLALGARVAWQVLVCEKLEALVPVIEMELMASN